LDKSDLFDVGIALTCRDGRNASVIVQISGKHAGPLKDGKAVRLSFLMLPLGLLKMPESEIARLQQEI